MNHQGISRIHANYILNSGEIAAGANKVMFDLFNNTLNDVSPADIYLWELNISPKTDVAVTGAVSARFDGYRTDNIGTGGTLHVIEPTVPTGLAISRFNTNTANLPANITARQAPTGGAHIKSWLFGDYIFPEETNAGSLLQGFQNMLPHADMAPPIVLHPGEGFVITQGSVATVNSFAFTLIFGLARWSDPTML